MSASRLDAVYRSFLLTKFFTKGWGKPENLRRLFEFRKVVSNRDECYRLIDRDYPVTITKEERTSEFRVVEGYFESPLEKLLPGIVPAASQRAHFQALFPLRWPDPLARPVCLHLAGTGDHYFWRRRNLMVKPLLKEAGIGGIILENPFYGLRKPHDQVRSSLHNVSDIFVMGGCLILEALVLFHWCERNGLGPLGVTGLSMGGHMASLAATNWPKPLVLVPCLSWSTASAVFLQGVMAQSINWDLLEDQYLSDGAYREKLSKMVTVVDEAFLAGKTFAQKFSETVDHHKLQESEKAATQTHERNIDVTYRQNNEPTPSTDNEPTTGRDVPAPPPENTTLPDELTSKDEVAIKSKGSQVVEEIDSAEMQGELRRLLSEGKIAPSLYDKLAANDKFELQPGDIEQLNLLHQEKVVVHIANKYKLGLGAQTHNKSYSSDKCVRKSADCVTRAQPPPTTEPEPLKHKKEASSRSIAELTSDVLASLPFVRRAAPAPRRHIDISKIHWRDREALQFMRGVMDECTHLSNFSVPFDTSLIIAVCARHDAYVPREDVGSLEDIWPGAEVRYVDSGHVSAYLLHQSLFRSCIAESFERSKKKWRDGKHIDTTL